MLQIAAIWALNPLVWLVVLGTSRVSGRVLRSLALWLRGSGARLRWFLSFYGVFILLDPFPRRAGYASLRVFDPVTRWMKSWPMFVWLARWFQLRLRVTVPLAPGESYFFVCHPHGIFGYGTWLNFGTFATDMPARLPGVRTSLLGASAFFYVPVLRELCMLFGCGTVEKRTITGLLRGGDSVVINLGGARESLDACPGSCTLQLSRRKGFARIALETGASLVPVMSFGENEVYRVCVMPRGSVLRKLQEALSTWTGSTLPFFYGLPWLPFFPRSSPITTVVGAPIEVRKLEVVRQQDVDELHRRYTVALRELFENNKIDSGFGTLELELL